MKEFTIEDWMKDQSQVIVNKNGEEVDVQGKTLAWLLAHTLYFKEESEDERIRELCITAVNIAASADGGLLHSEASECLTWLEEQKDKNCLACDQHLKGYIAGRKVTEEEKQKEQKPAEWSEKEKGILLECISALQNSGHWFLADKLSSLRPQPKQEWSEEDSRMIETIIDHLERHKHYLMSTLNIESCQDWLKALRPQPREEIYHAAKHDLAIRFMNYLDENRPNEKMNLSNGECEDIDKAFKENDWAKILRYAEKYGK